MHNNNPQLWQHSHSFGQDKKRPGEQRTLIVIIITGMMIVEIVTGVLFGSMDPLMGIVGAILVARWSFGLLHSSSYILLDRQVPKNIRQKIKESIEKDMDSKITDMHLCSIGPDIYAAIVAIVAHEPATPDKYKERIPKNLGLKHVSLEIHQCGTTGF